MEMFCQLQAVTNLGVFFPLRTHPFGGVVASRDRTCRRVTHQPQLLSSQTLTAGIDAAALNQTVGQGSPKKQGEYLTRM